MHILGSNIKVDRQYSLNFNKVKHYTSTAIDVPVIINRSSKSGPVVLLMGGLHGDEINGIEVVRQLITKKYHIPKMGTIICMPVLNIFGFLNMEREFPDGRDLNRSFPGYKSGSLAGRFAYQLVNDILPHVDIILDFHTGGAQRFNVPQVRIDAQDDRSYQLAKIFNAPFLLHKKNIKGTLRHTCTKLNKSYVLFEGGKSQTTDKRVISIAVDGVVRVLSHLNMLDDHKLLPSPINDSIIITDSKWLRAAHSGLFHPKVPDGKWVEKGEYIATITDPFGKFRHKVKASHPGYIINVNHSALVYQGDAIYNISKHHEQ